MATYIAFLCSVALTVGCLALQAQKRLHPAILWALSVIVLVGCTVVMWQVSDPPELFSDFAQAYYPAGQNIVRDVPRLYDRLTGCDESAVCGFVNIPVIALLFAPLSRLSLNQAQLAFALLSLGCIVGCVYCLIALTAATGWKRWAIAALFALNGPLFYSFREGNLTHVVLLLLVLALLCIEQDKEVWAGVLVASAAVIKLPLGLLCAYFLFKGRWRIVAGLGMALLGIVGTSFWWAGWESHVTWYRESVLPFSSKSLAAFNVQSVDGFLLRLQPNAPLYDWTPIPVDGTLQLARTGLTGALLVISGMLLCLGRSRGDSKDMFYVEFCVVLCLALMISPISWTHYYLLLLIPFSLYLGGRLPIQESGNRSFGMMMCLLLTSPPVLFLAPSYDSTAGIVLISHYLFGALGLWGILCLALGRGTRTQTLAVQIPLKPYHPTSRYSQDSR